MAPWWEEAPLASESQVATLETPAAVADYAKAQKSFLDEAPLVPVHTVVADYEEKSHAALVQRAREHAMAEPFENSDVHGPRPRLNTPDVEKQATEHLKQFPGVNPIEAASIYQRAKHYYRLAASSAGDIEPSGQRKRLGSQTITESRITSSPTNQQGENLEHLQKIAAQVPVEDRPLFLGIMADYSNERHKKAPERTFSEKFLERINRGVAGVPNSLASLPKYFGGDEKAADDWRFMQQIRGIKEGYDPATTDNWIGKGLLAAARMAPPMLIGGMAGSGIGAGVGALAGEAAGGMAGGVAEIGFWGGQEAPGMYEEMRQQGINHDTAAKLAIVTAPLIGGIEAAQVGQAAKPFSEAAKGMAKKAFAKKLAVDLIKTNFKENVEEDLQSAVSVAARAYGTYLDKHAKGIDWSEEVANFKQSAFETALALPFIQAPGAAVGGYKGYRQNLKMLSLGSAFAEMSAKDKTDASAALERMSEAGEPIGGGLSESQGATKPVETGGETQATTPTPPVTEGTPNAQQKHSPTPLNANGSSGENGQGSGPSGQGIPSGGQSGGEVPGETGQPASSKEAPQTAAEVNPYGSIDVRHNIWATEGPEAAAAYVNKPKKTVGELPVAKPEDARDSLWKDAQAIASDPNLPEIKGTIVEQAVDKAARAGLLETREDFDHLLDQLAPHADAPIKEQAKRAAEVLNQMRNPVAEQPAPSTPQASPPADLAPLVPDREIPAAIEQEPAAAKPEVKIQQGDRIRAAKDITIIAENGRKKTIKAGSEWWVASNKIRHAQGEVNVARKGQAMGTGHTFGLEDFHANFETIPVAKPAERSEAEIEALMQQRLQGKMGPPATEAPAEVPAKKSLGQKKAANPPAGLPGMEQVGEEATARDRFAGPYVREFEAAARDLPNPEEAGLAHRSVLISMMDEAPTVVGKYLEKGDTNIEAVTNAEEDLFSNAVDRSPEGFDAIDFDRGQILEKAAKHAAAMGFAKYEQERTAKEKPRKKKTLTEKASDARAEFETSMDEAAAVIRKFGLGINQVFNPEIAAAVAKMGAKAVKAGVYTFADFTNEFAKKIARDKLPGIKQYLQHAWDVAVEIDTTGKSKPEDYEVFWKTQEAIEPAKEHANVGQTEQAGAEPKSEQPAAVPRVENGPGEPGANAAQVSGKPARKRRAGKRTESAGAGTQSNPEPAAGSVSGGTTGDVAGNGTAGESDTGKRKLGGRRTAKPAGAEETQPLAEQSIPDVKPEPVKVRDLAAENHVIKPDAILAVRSEKESLANNIAAIKLLKQLEEETRNATPVEKGELAKFTGWGGLSQAFDRAKGNAMEQGTAGWRRDEAWERKWGQAYRDIKNLLTEEEWEKARDTTINAHYTSRDVIQKMWSIAEHLGFRGGRVLEPGAGVGHFAGLVPASVRGETKFSLVELDSVSSRLLKKLYPEAHTFGMGMEEFRAAPGSLDLVIGNVPFAKEGPADALKRYGQNLNLHNYFIARSLDAVRPGGLVVAISTHNTLDAAQEQRKLLASKGELLGAIRLPNDAFKENAKTEVVTDILIFRKPIGNERLGQPFTNTEAIGLTGESERDVTGRINEYFAAHPEMVLGYQSARGSMYGKDEYTVESTPGNLAEKIETAMQNLPANVFGGQQAQGEIVEAGPQQGTKEGLLRIEDGKLQLATGGKWVEVTAEGRIEGYPAHLFGEQGIKRAQGYIGIRDAYSDLRKVMLSAESTDAEIKDGQDKLQQFYDEYVAEHGQLNEGKTRIFQTDPEFYRVLSLEHRRIFRNKDTGAIRYVYEPASVFTKRTLGPREAPASVSTVKDGLWVSLGYRGGVDAEYIAQLTGKSTEDVTGELISDGLAYKDPATQALAIRERYLSGNVREKLRQAEIAAEDDAAYQVNVDALKAVQPERVPIAKVSARLGGNWIPPTVATAFAQKIFNDRYAQAVYGEQGDSWTVVAQKNNAAVESQWGTGRVDAREILADALNLRTPKVMDKVPTGEFGENGKEKYTLVLNEKETIAAKAKLNEMQKEFRKLIDTNEHVAAELEDAYNHTFNAYVDPVYNGSHLELPGANTEIELRPYQKNAIWRNLLDRYSLMAHAVGAGKTYTMIATAMEMRRLGLAKRPLLVVQNATLGQFATSFMEMYPNANVMVADKDDLQESNRHLFLSRITSGDWEAVVMAQSTFDRLANNPETAKQFVNDQLAALEEAIHEEGGREKNPRANSATVKDLVKARKALEKQLDKILETEKKNEGKNLVHFEDLHSDALFLDEAHAYKKPFFITKLDNLVGLNKQASARGVSTMMKVRTIQNLNQGKNVFFATGTPITNTLGEAWHMMNFVAPHVNEDFGVKTFDGFVGAFALKDTVREMNAGGQWVPKDALVKFTNGPELIRYLRAGWDILSPDDLRAYMNANESALPELKDGKVQAVTVEQTPGVAKLMDFMKSVYARFKAMPAKDRREYSYIPAVAYGAAKAGSLDIRLVYPEAAEEADSKLNRAVDLLYDEYDRSTDKKGVQLFFSDVFNPRSMETLHNFMAGEHANIEVQDSGPENAEGGEEQPEREAFLFQELKKKLIAKGIPAGEIAIVGEANTDTKRDVLFERANSGDVRVLLGSSAKMGVGVNVQKKLVALHHFDAPWLPADVEQREGRIIRFGNENKQISIYRYAMKNTLDAAIFTKTIRKAKFIWQALAGKFEGREFDDPASQTTMSIEEQLAAIQGDPLLFLKMDLDRERRDLELERESHQDQIQRNKSAIKDYQAEIKRTENETIPNQLEEIEFASQVNGEEPSITYEGTVIDEPKEIDAAIKKIREENEERVLKLTKAKKLQEGQPGRFRALDTKHFQSLSTGFTIGPYRGHISTGAYTANVGDGKREWVTESIFTLNRPGSTYNLYDGNATTGMGLWRAVANLPERLENSLRGMQERVATRRKEIADLEAVSDNPWTGQEQLDKVTTRLAEIETELFAKGANTEAPATEDTEGEEKGLPASAGQPPAKKKTLGQKKAPVAGTATPSSPSSQAATAPSTPQTLNPVIDTAAKLAKGVKQVWDGIRSVTMPMTMGPEAKQTAAAFREMFARKARRLDIALERQKQIRKYFNKQSDDAKANFYDGIEHGDKQPDADTQQAADTFRDILDGRREEARALPNGKAKLREYDENYFPHQWENPDAAKAFLGEWKGNKPLQGSRGWFKKRTVPTIKEGIARGLKLKYSNPVDMVMNKIADMDAYILSQQLLEGDLKDAGLVIYIRSRGHVPIPEGWIELNDPLFHVYGPPTIEVSEYVDQDIFNGLEEAAADLGVEHVRKTNVGKRRLGVSVTGGNEIQTQNATALSVLAHELGHQIDDKFGMQQIFGAGNAKSHFARELTAIADLRYEGEAGENASQKDVQYGQTPSEQMADVVAAYVTAPERMKEVAPVVYQKFDRFVKRTPKLKRLAKVKSGLALKRIDYEKAHGGVLKYGSYYAAPGAARVINNLYSKGISERFLLFRWALSASGAMNMFQLGYSAFHASTTAGNAIMGRLTSALQAVSTGNLKTAGRNLLLAPIAPVWDVYQGSKVLEEWRNPGKGGGDLGFLTDAIMSGGHRGKIDAEFAHKFTNNMFTLLHRGGMINKVLAAVNAPFALTEQVSRPIMEFLVPWAKAGVAAQKMRLKLEQKPNMTHVELREEAGRIVDAIDNQLGQLVYDNLFWPKWFKESLQFMVRSVGWTLGTERLLIGAPVDTLKQVGKIARLQKPELTENMAYAIMLPFLAGALGGALQYVMTGILPEDWKDLFYPRTGGKDSEGRWERVSLPLYFKEFYAYATSPVQTIKHKIHPALATVLEMMGNADYYGTKIYNEDDELVEKVRDLEKYALKQVIPFSFRGQQRLNAEGGSTAEQVLPMIGVTPAPASIIKSKAEWLAGELQHHEPGTRTQAQADRSSKRRELVREYQKHGKEAQPKIMAAVKAGEIEAADAREIIKRAGTNYLENAVKKLGAKDALKVYAAANPTEKARIYWNIQNHIANNQTVDLDQKQAWLRELGEPPAEAKGDEARVKDSQAEFIGSQAYALTAPAPKQQVGENGAKYRKRVVDHKHATELAKASLQSLGLKPGDLRKQLIATIRRRGGKSEGKSFNDRLDLLNQYIRKSH